MRAWRHLDCLAASPNITSVKPLKNNRTPMRMPMAQAPESGNWFQIFIPSSIDIAPLNAAKPQPLIGLS